MARRGNMLEMIGIGRMQVGLHFSVGLPQIRLAGLINRSDMVLLQYQSVCFQLSVHTLPVSDKSIQLGPEFATVVLASGMGKLMQDHVIHQFVRQQYELHVEADVVFMGATTPPCPLISDEHPVIGKPVPICQVFEPPGQSSLRLRSVDRVSIP